MQSHQANDGIDLVYSAIGLDTKVVFLAPRTGPEGRRAVVAGPGIDTVEHDHIDLA